MFVLGWWKHISWTRIKTCQIRKLRWFIKLKIFIN